MVLSANQSCTHAHRLALLRPDKIMGWRRRALAAGKPGFPVAYSSASPGFSRVAADDVVWVITLLDLPSGRVPSLVAKIVVDDTLREGEIRKSKRDQELWDGYGCSWVKGNRVPVVAVAGEDSYLMPFFDASRWLRQLRFPKRRGKKESYSKLVVPVRGDPAWSRFGRQLQGPRCILEPKPEIWERKGWVPAAPVCRGEGVFLSYKWDEASPRALELALALSHRGTPVWLDSIVMHRTRTGTPDAALKSLIRLGIQRSRAVVALTGRLYAEDREDASSWIGWERLEAQNLKRALVDVPLGEGAWVCGALRQLEQAGVI